MNRHRISLWSLLIALFTLVIANVAEANTLTLSATYYSVSKSDKDFYTGYPDYSGPYNVYPSMVTQNLSQNGLPVLSNAYSGPTVYDLTANKEITWWSPSLNPKVTSNGTGTITLPFDDPTMFVPMGNGTSDQNGFLTAVFTGILSVAPNTTEHVTYSLGSDDDSFLYIDGILKSSIGGIHENYNAPTSIEVLTTGTHTITLFYADRNATDAKLKFNISGETVNVNPVPEPGTCLLLGTGLLGLVMGFRRRKD